MSEPQLFWDEKNDVPTHSVEFVKGRLGWYLHAACGPGVLGQAGWGSVLGSRKRAERVARRRMDRHVRSHRRERIVLSFNDEESAP